MVAFGHLSTAGDHRCTTVQLATECKADLTHDCQKTLRSEII